MIELRNFLRFDSRFMYAFCSHSLSGFLISFDDRTFLPSFQSFTLISVFLKSDILVFVLFFSDRALDHTRDAERCA